MKRPSLVSLLREARWLIDAANDACAERLAAVGLTVLDRRLLALLEAAGRPRTPRSLARALLCPASALEVRLRALQERALVAKVTAVGPTAATFEIRASGRRVLRSLSRAERRFEAALEGALDDEDVRRAVSLLRAVRGRVPGGRHSRRRLRVRDVTEGDDFDTEGDDFDRARRVAGAAGVAGVALTVAGAA